MIRTIQIRLQFDTEATPHPSSGTDNTEAMIAALEWMGTTTSAIEKAVGEIEGINAQSVAVHSWAEDCAPLREEG